jgi:2-methylisocitrate lyase-like PEP mutase family enzyme
VKESPGKNLPAIIAPEDRERQWNKRRLACVRSADSWIFNPYRQRNKLTTGLQNIRVERIKSPLHLLHFANIIEGGKTPNLSVQKLEEMGYKLAAFVLSGLFSVTQALQDYFGRLKQDGSTENVNQNLSFEQFKGVIQIDKHIGLERKFSLL